MKYVLFLLSCLCLLLLPSCNEKESASATSPVIEKKLADTTISLAKGKKPKTWPEYIIDSVYGKITMDYSDSNSVIIMAPPCGTKVTHGWGTHHYEPKAGKVLGVCPWDYSLSNWQTLKNKWGYSGAYCGDASQYDLVTGPNMNFSNNNILYNINYTWYNRQELIDKLNSRPALYYYIDEAVNHGCGINEGKRLYQAWEIPDIASEAHSRGSYFVSSGYKYCDHMAYLTTYCDIIMYSGYHEWYRSVLPGCNTNMGWSPDTENLWIKGQSDQRPAWTEWKNRYGSKYSMTWINTFEITEFSTLFGHAANLGINKVFVYGAGDPDNNHGAGPVPHWNDQWENISYAAWLGGYLRRFEVYLDIYWKCSGGCDCDPDDPDAGWYIDEIHETYTIREAL
jgi:hypothetical protein